MAQVALLRTDVDTGALRDIESEPLDMDEPRKRFAAVRSTPRLFRRMGVRRVSRMVIYETPNSPPPTPTTFPMVEPYAGDTLTDNLNPVGKLYYATSTMLCTPGSLAQEVGLGLGAQAGEARLRDVITQGGFTRFRKATETSFNLILEARP